MKRDGGSNERRRQEPCVEWTRDSGVTRGGGGALRGDATSSWRGKREAIERQMRGGGAVGHEAAAQQESQCGQCKAI